MGCLRVSLLSIPMILIANSYHGMGWKRDSRLSPKKISESCFFILRKCPLWYRKGIALKTNGSYCYK